MSEADSVRSDAGGTGRTTIRSVPPATYVGFGNYLENDITIALGGFGLTVGWIVALRQWSAAAKTWRRPAAPRLPMHSEMPGIGGRE